MSVINHHYSLCNNPEERSSLLLRTYTSLMSKENTRDESILYMDLYWVYRLYGYQVCAPCEQREDATSVLCWRQNINTSLVNAQDMINAVSKCSICNFACAGSLTEE